MTVYIVFKVIDDLGDLGPNCIDHKVFKNRENAEAYADSLPKSKDYYPSIRECRIEDDCLHSN